MVDAVDVAARQVEALSQPEDIAPAPSPVGEDGKPQRGRKNNRAAEAPAPADAAAGDEPEADAAAEDEPAPADAKERLYVVRLPRPEADPADKEKQVQLEVRLKQLDEEIAFIGNAMRVKRLARTRARTTLGSTREALQAMSAQIRAKQEDMKPFTDRRRAERDEVQGVKDRAKEIAFRSEADLDAALAEMEHRITHESIPLSEEKNIVKLIKKYNSQREMIREYESARVQVAANRLTEEEREEVSAAIVHLKADLSNLRKQEEEWRQAFLKAKEEDNSLGTELDTLVAERDAARDKRSSLYGELNKLRRQQYQSSGDYYKGYRRIVEQVRKLYKAGQVEEAVAMCEEQMDKQMAKLNGDDAYRTEYVQLMEKQNPRKRFTAAEAEVDAEILELEGRARKGDPIARREASALDQKRRREAAKEAARKAVEDAKAEAKAKLEAQRNAKAEAERIAKEEEERREQARLEEEARIEAQKRADAAAQLEIENKVKAKKSQASANAALEQMLKPIDVEALPLEKFELQSHVAQPSNKKAGSNVAAADGSGQVPLAAIAEAATESIQREMERMREMSAAGAREKRIAAEEKKRERAAREAEEEQARRARNAERNKRKKLAKAASRDQLAAEPETVERRWGARSLRWCSA